MTVRYVGIGGSDGADGLSWANRKETLDGVEDTPVVAGDTVYVGPGTYRESLTCDVAGSVGQPITYIGDISGVNTDGIGGIIRITGSDDDLDIGVRSPGISATQNYRTFRGFYVDSFDINLYMGTGASGGEKIIENCTFVTHSQSSNYMVVLQGKNCVLRSCFLGSGFYNLSLYNASAGDHGNVIENCFFWGGVRGFDIQNQNDVIVKNCTFFGTGLTWSALRFVGSSTPAEVRDCVFCTVNEGIDVSGTAPTVSHTAYRQVEYDRVSGTGNINYTPFFNPRMLVAGMKLPWMPFDVVDWNDAARITHQTTPTDDVRGIARPVTSSKSSRGGYQISFPEQATAEGEVRRGDTSICLPDAQRTQLFVLIKDPTKKFRVSVYVKREADYAGSNPQLIIKRPGRSDITVTDTGGASSWNRLATSFTPEATDKFCILEIVSRNTATSGYYNVFFDSFDINNLGNVNFGFIYDNYILLTSPKKTPFDTWVTPDTPPLDAGPQAAVSGVYPSFFRP